MHEIHGILPVRIATLPLTNLHHATVALSCANHDVALLDTVAKRLFAVNVLAGLARCHQL